MPSENVVLFGESVLPPALAAGITLVVFIAWQYWLERRQRRGFRRSLEGNHSQASAQTLAGGPPRGDSGSATANHELDAFPAFGSYFLDHFGRYGLALLFVGVTLVIRLLLEPVLHGRLAFGFFLLAVIGTALVADIWETLLALVVGYLTAAWFFVQPVGFGIGGADGWLGAALYFVTGLGIIWFMKSEHRAWLRTLDRDIAYVDKLKELDQERASNKHQEGHDRLARIVASAQDAILSVSQAGRIATWNTAAERLLGFPAREAIGQPLALIVSPEPGAEQQRILEQVNRGERHGEWHTVLRCKNGSSVAVSLTLSPMNDDSGKLIGASVIARLRSPK